MDRLHQLLTDHKIPLGLWVKDGVKWITDNFYDQFDAFSRGLAFLIENFAGLLAAVPPLVLVLLICAFGYWLHRSWGLVALIAGGLGTPVVRALSSVNIGLGFEAGLAIVIVGIQLPRKMSMSLLARLA